jgi:hypothetical protein
MNVWMVSLLLGIGAAAGMDDKVRLAVTQRDLVPECLNGSGVERGTRGWTIAPGQVSLVLSMRSQARPGRPQPDSGHASISFTAEADHRYEVEVRAEPEAFSSRAWRAGEWTPVVRDRTTDRLVSSEPQWTAGSCGVRHN